MGGLAGKRLGALTPQLITLMKKVWPQLASSMALSTLVHCDFNPKNILLADGSDEPWILDWEFAMAGDPLIDLGNFFRFADDYPSGAQIQLLNAYQAQCGLLPKDWQTTARLHDLISMIQFLNSPEEKPHTFDTARMIIEKTLQDSSLAV